MNIVGVLKKNKLLVIVVLAYMILFVTIPQRAVESSKNSMYYILEMLQIMPVIFILTSLIEAWVPRETIIKGFGKDAGFKGSILAFILGSFSAGPIYAAFPVCKMLLKKGASVSNIIIILSSWAVVKVPMLANEAKFLGPRFMLVRWVLTSIAIFIMAYIIPAILGNNIISVETEESREEGSTINIKQQYCVGCGMCAKLYPEDFVITNGKAMVRIKEITKDNKEGINRIIKKCPAQAIFIK